MQPAAGGTRASRLAALTAPWEQRAAPLGHIQPQVRAIPLPQGLRVGRLEEDAADTGYAFHAAFRVQPLEPAAYDRSRTHALPKPACLAHTSPHPMTVRTP